LSPVNMMIGALKPFLRRMRTASRPPRLTDPGTPTLDQLRVILNNGH